MKKILHVAETIKGGVATILRQLMKETGNFNLFCLVPEDQREEIRGSSAKVITFKRSGRNIRSCCYLAIEFIKIYRHERPDIVHIHSSFAGLICRILLCLFPGSPKVIYCPHAFSFLMDTSDWKKKIYGAIEKLLSLKTDVIVCVSQYEHDEAVKWCLDKNKLIVIYNGVEPPEAIVDKNVKVDIENNGLSILFVGRLDYQKGIDIVEKIASELGEKCRVVVVGGGVHSNPRLARSENIIYVGWVSKEKMANYYLQADVLLMPSRWESFGLVAVEAQSYGLPVVASHCSSLPEVVLDGTTGFLFPVGDVGEACKILRSLNQPELSRMKENAICFYQNNFTSAKMIEKTSKLYN